MTKDSRPNEASSGLNGHQARGIPVAMLLILVVLVSAASGTYVGASFFPQQAPNVTVTTTVYTTTTSWTTSTIWSTMTSVVYGVWTTVQYTTSTSTVTVTGSTSTRTAKIVTAKGNAQISAAQSKSGGTSGLFNGNGAYLSTPDSADWYFGTGDFTIDFWVWFNALPAVGKTVALYSQGDAAANWYSDLNICNRAGTYRLEYAHKPSGGAQNIYVTNTISLSTGSWIHIAVVRSGNSWYMFKDGTQIGATATDTDSISDLASELRVSACGYTDPSGRFLNGWIDEYQISKGIARWTSNFIPSTSAPTGDSNTVLLLHMDGADGSNTFVDG